MVAEHHLYLVLGSNINPEVNLLRALELLRNFATIEAISSVWETPAVGSPGPNFLNLAAQVACQIKPENFKEKVIRPIENQLGRRRTTDKNAPRTIDIDIVIADGRILDPAVCQQVYLAAPLAEIIPNYCCSNHPAETLTQLAERLSQTTPIKLRSDLNVSGSLKHGS